MKKFSEIMERKITECKRIAYLAIIVIVLGILLLTFYWICKLVSCNNDDTLNNVRIVAFEQANFDENGKHDTDSCQSETNQSTKGIDSLISLNESPDNKKERQTNDADNCSSIGYEASASILRIRSVESSIKAKASNQINSYSCSNVDDNSNLSKDTSLILSISQGDSLEDCSNTSSLDVSFTVFKSNLSQSTPKLKSKRFVSSSALRIATAEQESLTESFIHESSSDMQLRKADCVTKFKRRSLDVLYMSSILKADTTNINFSLKPLINDVMDKFDMIEADRLIKLEDRTMKDYKLDNEILQPLHDYTKFQTIKEVISELYEKNVNGIYSTNLLDKIETSCNDIEEVRDDVKEKCDRIYNLSAALNEQIRDEKLAICNNLNQKYCEKSDYESLLEHYGIDCLNDKRTALSESCQVNLSGISAELQDYDSLVEYYEIDKCNKRASKSGNSSLDNLFNIASELDEYESLVEYYDIQSSDKLLPCRTHNNSPVVSLPNLSLEVQDFDCSLISIFESLENSISNLFKDFDISQRSSDYNKSTSDIEFDHQNNLSSASSIYTDKCSKLLTCIQSFILQKTSLKASEYHLLEYDKNFLDYSRKVDDVPLSRIFKLIKAKLLPFDLYLKGSVYGIFSSFKADNSSTFEECLSEIYKEHFLTFLLIEIELFDLALHGCGSASTEDLDNLLSFYDSSNSVVYPFNYDSTNHLRLSPFCFYFLYVYPLYKIQSLNEFREVEKSVLKLVECTGDELYFYASEDKILQFQMVKSDDSKPYVYFGNVADLADYHGKFVNIAAEFYKCSENSSTYLIISPNNEHAKQISLEISNESADFANMSSNLNRSKDQNCSIELNQEELISFLKAFTKVPYNKSSNLGYISIEPLLYPVVEAEERDMTSDSTELRESKSANRNSLDKSHKSKNNETCNILFNSLSNSRSDYTDVSALIKFSDDRSDLKAIDYSDVPDKLEDKKLNEKSLEDNSSRYSTEPKIVGVVYKVGIDRVSILDQKSNSFINSASKDHSYLNENGVLSSTRVETRAKTAHEILDNLENMDMIEDYIAKNWLNCHNEGLNDKNNENKDLFNNNLTRNSLESEFFDPQKEKTDNYDIITQLHYILVKVNLLKLKQVIQTSNLPNYYQDRNILTENQFDASNRDDDNHELRMNSTENNVANEKLLHLNEELNISRPELSRLHENIDKVKMIL